MCSFPDFKQVICSTASSNCCFLTCIQVSQEAGKVVWYSHPFKNFLQFFVIHTVKGLSIVNEAEVIFFWNSPAFSMTQRMLDARLDESQARIKIARRNFNNFQYVDDTTLMAESEQQLKSLFMRVKEKS